MNSVITAHPSSTSLPFVRGEQRSTPSDSPLQRGRADDKGGREGRVINGLLATCLVLGFACFALFILPDQLARARVNPSRQWKGAPTKLSAIISLDAPASSPSPSAAPLRQKDVIPNPSTQGDTAYTPPSGGAYESDEAAGAAGAAIDNSSGEAREAFAYTEPRKMAETSAKASYPDEAQDLKDEEGETLQGPTTTSIRPGGPVEFKVHPISSLAHREPSALDSDKAMLKKSWLTIPEGLEADVAFWRDIYAVHDRNHAVLHHPRHLNIVYEVVDLTDIDSDVRLSDIEKERMMEKRVNGRQMAIVDTLRKLASNPPSSTLSDDEWRIKKLFAGATDVLARAAKEESVRVQYGQRDKFIPGLGYSGRYLGEIEKIFEAYDIPREITRLIFVESMFNTRAISSAGASGIWQFMRATGRLYLEVNNIIDERNDPIKATHAAAKLLRHNYEVLGSWPLAINAYNTGRGRIQQAVALTGTNDIGRIIREFTHPAYGFASRNFFLEFLAALDVAEHGEKYFGSIEYDRPLQYEIVRTNYNIMLPEVARISAIPLDTLVELNPGFTASVVNGLRSIPIGFEVRVPEKKGTLFLAAAARAPKSRSGPLSHVVEDGESLPSIAKMYGVRPADILRANDGMSRKLHRGQTILVPVGKR